ncbi:hypothetical protein KQX54_007632 [Cotesia glomerata]|uniref:Uncharacterized protein n=1 Tax=Cotesia glomerata TaxID=32391 RepID=A0AAV7HXV0_COTGL|nr:hypothetical protein KQX54_007632 [Cotesia glomerata]
MKATIVVALVLAITVQSAHSHLKLNLGLNTENSLNIGGFLGGVLGKVQAEKSLNVNVGHGNGISMHKEGMVSLGSNKWGFEKSGSVSIGGRQGGMSMTGHRGGSINIEGQDGYAQGQQSIHNEGHLHQNGGYEIGAQGSLTQNSGHYEQHSSVQNNHLGNSNSHFEQHGFQQSGSDQINEHVHIGHVESPNVHFGQKGFEQSGHGQIGDIFLVNQDKKSGNVHISSTEQSKIHVQQHGIEESNLGQTTGHSAHQTGGIIYELNTQGQKGENVHTGHVESSNDYFGQQESGESDYAHGKVEGSKKAGDIIVVIKDQNDGKIYKNNDINPNIHFGQQGENVHTGHVESSNDYFGQQESGESDYAHGKVEGSKKAGDIIVVIKDQNDGKIYKNNDINPNIHFGQQGENVHTGHVESSNDYFGQQESGESDYVHGKVEGSKKAGDIIVVIKDQNDGKIYKSNDINPNIHFGQQGENVHTGHVESSNDYFGQQESGESDYAHGKVEGSKKAGDIIVVIKDQNDGKIHKNNDINPNIHFGQQGIESNHDHIVIDGSKQGDIIVVIKDKNSGKVHGSHDESSKIYFKDGVAQSGSSHVIGSSEHKTNDHNLVMTGESSATVHNSQGSIKTDWDQVTGHSEDKTNDYDFKLHGQDGESVRNILSQNSKVNSEYGFVRGQGQTQGQSQLGQNQILTPFGKGQVQKESQSGDNQVQSQVQFGEEKGSEGSGLNKIFGFHKAGEILFGFGKPIGHDGHNKIEQNSNGHINVNRESSEEGSINVGSSVTGNKNSLIVVNEDDHTSNIKVGVNNQNSAKESVSGESSLSFSHGSEHSSIVGVGHHANVHDSTGQIEVTKEILNLGEKSHHSESSESNTHLKQGLWNSDFGFNKNAEKQSKVEINRHQESSSSARHSQSSVQHGSHSSHISSSHISSSHVQSSHSSSKFHQSINNSNIGKLENSDNSGEGLVDIRIEP